MFPSICLLSCHCNCNYNLFIKLPWPGDSKGTFRSSSQAATCPTVCHTRWSLRTLPFLLNVMQGSCEYQFLIVLTCHKQCSKHWKQWTNIKLKTQKKANKTSFWLNRIQQLKLFVLAMCKMFLVNNLYDVIDEKTHLQLGASKSNGDGDRKYFKTRNCSTSWR